MYCSLDEIPDSISKERSKMIVDDVEARMLTDDRSLIRGSRQVIEYNKSTSNDVAIPYPFAASFHKRLCGSPRRSSSRVCISRQ